MKPMTKPDVKLLIVQSATVFFSKFGFAKTTMDEIARHIHKAKGVLYYYFRNKEELFNEVLRQELAGVKEELSKVLADREDDALAVFRKYFYARLKVLKGAVNYHETLKADFFDRYHFVKDTRDDFMEFERNLLTQIFTQARVEGYLTVSDIPKTVHIILMVAYSIEIPLYLQNRYDEYEPTMLELSDMIVNSLRKSKG
jgi:AcrR family transcriptional regulator